MDLLALDAPAQGSQSRDGAMAEVVRSAMKERPKRLYVVMAGDVHAQKIKGAPWDPLYEPMAYQLSGEHPFVIDMRPGERGAAWVCTEALKGCGTFHYPGPQHSDSKTYPVFRTLAGDSGKYDAELVIPGTTASPPASAGAGGP